MLSSRNDHQALTVLDELGREVRIPLRPTGEDRLALERRDARETARRPLEDLLREMETAAHELNALRAGLQRG